MLARTVLRLCAVEALRPSTVPDGGPWPTLAQSLVFDSRLDPIEDLRAEERKPLIVVYTETQRLDRLAQHGGEYESRVDLVFELSIAGAEYQGDQFVAGVAYSDAEIESSLDLLEDQIFFALNFGASGALFRRLARLPLDDWQSVPHRSAEEGYRLAMRTVTVPVKLQPLCYDAAPGIAAEGLARLPRPLRGIVEELAQSSYGAQLLAGLAPAASVMPAAHPLNGVTVEIESKAPPSPASGNASPHVIAAIDGLQD